MVLFVHPAQSESVLCDLMSCKDELIAELPERIQGAATPEGQGTSQVNRDGSVGELFPHTL